MKPAVEAVVDTTAAVEEDIIPATAVQVTAVVDTDTKIKREHPHDGMDALFIC